MQRANRRLVQTRPDGYFDIRVFHRKGSKKRTPRYLLKCGCCSQKVEVYYDETGLEINGVNGSIQNWREILLPLLRIQKVKSRKRR